MEPNILLIVRLFYNLLSIFSFFRLDLYSRVCRFKSFLEHCFDVKYDCLKYYIIFYNNPREKTCCLHSEYVMCTDEQVYLKELILYRIRITQRTVVVSSLHADSRTIVLFTRVYQTKRT